jgi:tRNA threonylcarbamoyladenosine biosynthesis protein TsaB
MTSLRVLAIDTSTEACSAALLWSDGEAKLRFELTDRSHADLILPMIDQLLAEAGCGLRDLDGLAFGRGPGGFTGLRIAAGVIQGLAYGAGLRVAPVSSLAAVAWLVQEPSPQPSPAKAEEGAVTPSLAKAGEGAGTPSPSLLGEDRGEGILVCNDARMNEVYWACYRFDAAASCVPIALTPERVGPEASLEPASAVRHFAGNGVSRYPALRSRLESAGLRFHEGLYPRADAVARLGEQMLRNGETVAAAEALPVYVRDDIARPSRPAVTGMS